MAKLLKGAPVAKTLSEQVKDRVSRLKAKGVKPTLAIVRVGEQSSDIAYERGVVKRCEKIGVAVKHFILPANFSQQKLLDVIHEINADADVHGCLLFRPLPGHMNEHEVCEALAPDKDIDCITSGSLSGVFTGNGKGFSPCTAQACLEILSYYGYDPKGKRVTVIGRSLVIGRPVSMMLLRSDATVTVCHTKTKDMSARCREAELLIVAAGKAGIVDETYVSPNQVVIDVGINTDENGNLCGDVCFDKVEPIVGAITPVPGGVGTVTSMVLVKHVVEAAERI